MGELDRRLSELREALAGQAPTGDFTAVLRRRRQLVVRRTVLTGTVAALAALVGVAVASPGGGPDVLTPIPAQSPTVTPSPSPSPTASANPSPAPARPLPFPLEGGAAIRFAGRSTVIGIFDAGCTGAPGSCTPLVERSDDGGATWRVLSSLPQPSDSGGGPQLQTANGTDLWATTDGRHGYVSHDGGRSWTTVPALGGSVAGGEAWALTCSIPPGPNSCRPRVLRGPASGDTLTATTPPATSLVLGMQFVAASASTAYLFYGMMRASGFGYLLTTDAGRTWSRHSLPCSGSIDPTPDGTLWLLCAFEPGAGNQQKQLYRSTDSGRTWHSEPPPETSGYASNLVSIDATTAWRFGGRAPIYRTTDGGQTWQVSLTSVFNTGTGGPAAFAAWDANTAVAVFLDAVYRTSDGGRSWQLSHLPT